jgi:hypothetical protein
MKTWVVAILVMMGASGAQAKETLDLSKAISASELEKQNADQESRKKVRDLDRRVASDSKQKIVINLSNLEK